MKKNKQHGKTCFPRGSTVLLQVQVKVSPPRTPSYSNRCGAQRMHWRLKQQGMSCMTANGSRLTRTLRAAPSKTTSSSTK